ncbi:hypothetical protein [Gordonia sp. NPDC127522]|uniref:AraC-like ligand-binding domain-containing protein n=1 Tax=Gordonia sp. NPDC127522 TaxID=3345390 RepID=UPI0036262287
MSDSGLDPVVVDEWRQRNGRIGELGAHRSRQVRTRGREGIELFAELVELEADVPEVFEQICYWRPMTKLFGFCYLQTPVRTRRTPGRIRDFPSDFMIVTSQTIGSTTGTANGHDFRSRPEGLTVTDSRLPYDLTTHGVSDALGLWVPTELLGEAIAGGATVAPNPPESALTDACTALVTQFARDTIIGGADIDADAEQTVIDII